MRPTADVLVIDDERVVRDAIALVLGSAGWSVAGFADAGSALASPCVESCAVALCDLILPEPHGIDAIRELRRRRPDLPIVAITGCPTAEWTTAALQAGATELLAKPFDDEELSTRVRHVLEQAGAAGKEARR